VKFRHLPFIGCKDASYAASPIDLSFFWGNTLGLVARSVRTAADRFGLWLFFFDNFG
jgi:hypothetical protein